MRSNALVLLFVLSSIGAKAQQDYYQAEQDSILYPSSRLSLKLIPSQLLWRFPAYAFALEHGLKNNLGIEYKVGLIQNANNFDDDETYFSSKSGFKSSVTIKSYSSENGSIGSIFNFFNGDDYSQSGIKSFIGLEVFYNQINFDRTRTFRFDCQNGCQYFQRFTYGLTMKELGARVNIGVTSVLYGPLSFEATFGAGLASRSFNSDDRKPTDFQRMFGTFYDEDFQGTVGAFNLDLKLVIDIK